MKKMIETLLSEKPYTLADLTKKLNTNESAVSRELSRMEKKGSVRREQKGSDETGWTRFYYSTTPKKPEKEEKNEEPAPEPSPPKSSAKKVYLRYGARKCRFYPGVENVKEMERIAKKYRMEFSATIPFHYNGERTYRFGEPGGSNFLTITSICRGKRYSVKIEGTYEKEDFFREIRAFCVN